MTPHVYHPNFQLECRLCGTSPCVIVTPHHHPQTGLCGPHFFHLPEMVDWEKWNDSDEDPTTDEEEDSSEQTS